MLGNFSYCNPTKLYFGADSLARLENELGNYGSNVLLLYGAGSIKKSGLYDKVMAILTKSHKNVSEFAGVMANPTLDKLYEGIAVARENKIDFILAVGGGSVIDYAKALSASAHCNEDSWQKFFVNMEEPDNQVIPVGTMLTMVGTGSEMNGGSVITNTQAKLKLGKVFGEAVFPKFSILNPELTYTLPRYQMTAGFFDIMSHILEQYFSGDDDNTSDYVMEGLLQSLITSSLVALEQPENYEARSNIMWIATWALNTFVAKGKSTDWMVHMIGQQVGAYTNATHGMTLAAVSLPYYRLIMNENLSKFKRFAINVWKVDPQGKSDQEISLEGFGAMEAYMKKLELSLNISEFGVTEQMLAPIAASCNILSGGYKTLTSTEIEKILRQAL